MKVGIIRCQQTENYCPGTGCFGAFRQEKGAFENLSEDGLEVVGFISCGGCPGKNTVQRAEQLVARGAEAIALSSCITLGSPLGWPCPHHETMTRILEEKLSGKAKLLTFTHPAKKY